MVDLLTLAAVALLVLGVVGSVTPLLPGALLSLAGVYLYWWSTGYADPSLPVLVSFTVVGVAAAAMDYFGGAVAAKAGGASLLTTMIAAGVGVVLFFLTGPVGVLVGVAATVFLLELRRHDDARRSLRTTLYTMVGILGSAVVQLLFTLAMLVSFLLVVVL